MRVSDLGELIQAVCDDKAEALDELEYIAAARPDALSPYLAELAAAGIWWPHELYRGADTTLKADLIRRVDAGTGNVRAMLTALATAGGPDVEAAFARWSTRPPHGRDTTGHSLAGGWTLRDGRRRELCSATAYQLPGKGDIVGAAVTVGGVERECCPQCGMPLWSVLDADAGDPRVAAALAHTGWQGRLRMVTCHRCACYGTVFCEVEPGRGRWSEHTRRPASIGRDTDEWSIPHIMLALGERRGTPYQASAWEPGGSTLGGQPQWIQHWDYPDCARCGETMDYIALVFGGDLEDWGEGAYYLFLHAGCGLAAVTFQQS
ncbi:hypothetical protein [Allonocardiopsis opalescens]|uniref:DUF1963 domain-containing protein n=1 Tax=Allonocardiopsis opalescens TaxID=1144618 RepID=A0A2T0PTX7_9ACTN|nr:hypothetical protein [Allonocardiopsis opalescens]PRX92351.1 hypothetical protein CLV72_110111 [Allonocardiopsis opalescens]